MAQSILDIKEILEEYSDDIQEAITEEAEKVAKDGQKELKNTRNTYKVRTGKYNNGWRVKTEKGRGYIKCIIHNATNYQLTHLLENGHRIVGRDGRIKGNTRKFIHIKPVEEKSVKTFERNVEQIIRNGG